MSLTSKWTPKQKQASDELCSRFSFRHILTPTQRRFYDLVNLGEQHHYGLYSSRKQGKSFTILVMAWEFALKNPKTVQRIVLPELKQAKEIYPVIFNELKEVIPKYLWPRYLKMEGQFVFRNGSKICMGGTLPQNIESSRGPICHRLYLDEVAAFNASNYEYSLYSILLPQGTTIPNFTRIDATTPPKSPVHPWMQTDYPKLSGKNACLTFTILDNTLISDEMRERIIDAYGGVDNPNYRREHMCELISDNNLRLVPEFSKEKYSISQLPGKHDNFNSPVMFKSYVGCDLGLTDMSYMIFGWYDFIKDKFIVAGEWGATYKTFPEIFKAYEDGCKAHLKDDLLYEPQCVVDVWEIAAHDLRNTYGWSFRRPRKGKIEESINFLRDCFISDRIAIHESCKGLIAQLETGIWNPNRTDLERTHLGHSDAVMALVYALKEVRFGTRPTDLQLDFGAMKKLSKKTPSKYFK